MSPLPDDIAKIRDELAEEHKLLTKDNGIESSNYHFKAGFNAAAEIFLKREAELKNSTDVYSKKFVQYHDAYLKLQARVEKLVEFVQKTSCEYDRGITATGEHMIHRDDCRRCEALASDKEQG